MYEKQTENEGESEKVPAQVGTAGTPLGTHFFLIIFKLSLYACYNEEISVKL